MTVATPRVTGRFIEGPSGPLATTVWLPPDGEPARFGVLHVPAAGDELNKSRRVIADQARAFARRGGVVAVVDLRGMGDSAGEHGQATWAGWRADVEAAWAWLATLTDALPVVLWGLRLGGLLAAEIAVSDRIAPPDAMLLWQPVVSGRTFFNQWLRVASTQQLAAQSAGAIDVQALRTRLATGWPVEVAGYDIHPALIGGAQEIDLARLPPPACPVIWRETTVATPPELSPAACKVKLAWAAHALADFQAVSGPSFWASQELADAPALIAATTKALAAWVARVEPARP